MAKDESDAVSRKSQLVVENHGCEEILGALLGCVESRLWLLLRHENDPSIHSTNSSKLIDLRWEKSAGKLEIN